MSQQKLISRIIFFILLSFGVFLYFSQIKPAETPEPISPQIPIPEVESVDLSDPDLAGSVVEANNHFALDLFAQYQSQEGNLFFSPYSITSALAMTYEGAKEQTAREMQAVLHLPADKNQVRNDFQSINKQLNQADQSYKLSVANALWAQNNYPFEDAYLSVVSQYYDGKVTNLDFQAEIEKSRVTINDWVEAKTNSKIKNLISKGVLGASTKLVLTNAIYFKADWVQQFEANSTSDGKFAINSDQKINAQFMHETSNYNYGETKDIQILEMDYLGNEVSMLILLPKNKNSLNKLENELSQDELSSWKKDMLVENVRVTLPKFTFETKYSLAKNLQSMGMPTAFSDTANFTGISPTGALNIDQVIHQTFIEVAEEGTEASAATAVVIIKGMAPLELDEPINFKADHPFLFIIQQKESGNILFLGRLNNPNQS